MPEHLQHKHQIIKGSPEYYKLLKEALVFNGTLMPTIIVKSLPKIC